MDGQILEFVDTSLAPPVRVDPYYVSWLMRRMHLHTPPEIVWAVPEVVISSAGDAMESTSIGLDAVGVDPEKSLIFLHPFLYHRNAPQFILKYLVFSAALLMRPTITVEQSKLIHLVQKKYEVKANRWLNKYGFESIVFYCDATS